jgi:hypothetical protein
MRASSSFFDFVLRTKTIGEDPPLKGQENAAIKQAASIDPTKLA